MSDESADHVHPMNWTENHTYSEDEQLAGLEFMIYFKFWCAIALIVCSGLGLYGNGMSTIIFLHPTMRSPINFLLAAVSMIDFILMLLLVPVLIIPGINILIEDPMVYSFYAPTILFLYPIGMAAQSASVWTYVLVVVERYIAVCQPLKSYRLLTNRQARRAQLGIVIAAIAYNIVRFWEYKWTPAGLVPNLRSGKFYSLFYYTTLHLVTHFLLPMSTILILNTSIVQSLQKPYDDGLCLPRVHNANNACANLRRQRKTTWMIVVATCVFMMTNTLPFMVNLWETLNPKVLIGTGWPTFMHALSVDVANFLLASHSAFTFLIYVKYCRQYRVLFRRITLKMFEMCGYKERRKPSDSEQHFKNAEAARLLDYSKYSPQNGICKKLDMPVAEMRTRSSTLGSSTRSMRWTTTLV